MGVVANLKGSIFGDIKVIEYMETKNTHAYWKVKCMKCAETKIVSASNLISGYSSQCNVCGIEERASVKKADRLLLCLDYISGMNIADIMEKYDIKNRGKIYRILVKEGITERQSTQV